MKRGPASFSFYPRGKWWAQGLIIFFVLVLASLSALQTYAWFQRGRIYPGVMVGSFPMAGLTLSQAEETLQAALEPIRSQGLVFTWRSRTITVPPIASAADDPDLAYQVINYDLAKTRERLASFGRQGSFYKIWQDRLRALLGQAEVEPVFSWRQDRVLDVLKSNLSSLEEPGRNATFSVQGQEITILPERSGLIFDYELALEEAQKQLLSLIFKPIPLTLKREVPTILARDVEPLLTEARAFLSGADITVSHASSTWPLSRQDLTRALEPKLTEEGAVLGLNREKLKELLLPSSEAINIPSQEPKFKLENNRVVEFKAAQVGREIDIDKTAEAWEQELIQEGKTELALAVIEKEPAQQIADLNNLGIKELLGVGQSNFKGSPQNRRHNIAVGAAAVNGTLIAPGEIFSLLKTLGRIDASTGYLPELVIKGNKTVPEYGGGLCQIGTTTFRGTLAAGLPIVERQNHSYAVTYYNNAKGLPGTDATIYDPKPDYRFKNDMTTYVLITTRIVGDDLFFEFWGTKDGRQIEQSEVRVWDRVSPPPTKLVETLDLKPGAKKCTEKPHAGMKASFDYQITYADGRIDKQTFNSQYRAWQEVCLIGVEKLSGENGNATASSTLEVLPQDSSAAIVN